MVYKYLGWGITNENGVAKLDHDAQGQEIEHSYTGTGAGEIDVLASLDNPIVEGSIVSETFSVLDCITTTNDKNIWGGGSNVVLTNVTDGVKFTESSGTAKVYLYLNSQQLCLPVDESWAIEFDIYSNVISFYFTDSTSSDGNQFIAYNDTNCNDCIRNIDLSETNHIKLVYDSINHTIKTYANDTTTASPKTMDTSSFSNDISFKLIDWQGDMDCTISNLKIYRT